MATCSYRGPPPPPPPPYGPNPATCVSTMARNCVVALLLACSLGCALAACPFATLLGDGNAEAVDAHHHRRLLQRPGPGGGGGQQPGGRQPGGGGGQQPGGPSCNLAALLAAGPYNPPAPATQTATDVRTPLRALVCPFLRLASLLPAASPFLLHGGHWLAGTGEEGRPRCLCLGHDPWRRLPQHQRPLGHPAPRRLPRRRDLQPRQLHRRCQRIAAQ